MNSKFETEKLRSLCADFYTLTGIKVTVYDTDFSMITAYPEDNCEYCRIVRSDPAMAARCVESDEAACRALRGGGGVYAYRCHAGLAEVAVPIKMNGITLGYIIFGQMADAGTADTAARLCTADGCPAKALQRALKQVPVKSDAELRAGYSIMESCASYMWLTGQVRFVESNFIYQLTSYINRNLTGDLSVDRLCEVFGVSRRRLYRITGEYMDAGVATYIRRARVARAAALLAGGASVSGAAGDSGFDDYNYFSKIFRRETGLAPSEYRRRALAEGLPPGKETLTDC